MVIEFEDNNKGTKDIFVREGKDLLKIFYGENGDLYFDIFGNRNRDENGQLVATFCIKETDEIYQYFDQLMNSIIDCKVFIMSKIEFDFGKSDNIEGKISFLQQINEDLKIGEVYKRLVQNNNSIVWYSDNTYDENANILKIERECGKIKLTFVDNPEDSSFRFGIRICNSASKHAPFNMCFMNLFNQLQLLDKKNQAKRLVQTENSCK